MFNIFIKQTIHPSSPLKSEGHHQVCSEHCSLLKLRHLFTSRLSDQNRQCCLSDNSLTNQLTVSQVDDWSTHGYNKMHNGWFTH